MSDELFKMVEEHKRVSRTMHRDLARIVGVDPDVCDWQCTIVHLLDLLGRWSQEDRIRTARLPTEDADREPPGELP